MQLHIATFAFDRSEIMILIIIRTAVINLTQLLHIRSSSDCNIWLTSETVLLNLPLAGDVDSQHLLQELQNDFKGDFLSSCQV